MSDWKSHTDTVIMELSDGHTVSLLQAYAYYLCSLVHPSAPVPLYDFAKHVGERGGALLKSPSQGIMIAFDKSLQSDEFEPVSEEDLDGLHLDTQLDSGSEPREAKSAGDGWHRTFKRSSRFWGAVPMAVAEDVRVGASALALFGFSQTCNPDFKMWPSVAEKYGFSSQRHSNDREQLVAVGLLQATHTPVQMDSRIFGPFLRFEREALLRPEQLREPDPELAGIRLFAAARPPFTLPVLAQRFRWSTYQTRARVGALVESGLASLTEIHGEKVMKLIPSPDLCTAAEVSPRTRGHSSAAANGLIVRSRGSQVSPSPDTAVASDLGLGQRLQFTKRRSRALSLRPEDKRRLIRAAGGRVSGSVFADVLWKPESLVYVRRSIDSKNYCLEDFERELRAIARDPLGTHAVASWEYVRVKIDATRQDDEASAADVSLDSSTQVVQLGDGVFMPLSADDISTLEALGGVSAAQKMAERLSYPVGTNSSAIFQLLVQQLRGA